MLSVTISTKVIVWLCKELDCEALWAEEFAQNFISFLQASGSISIAQEKETSEKEMLQSLVFWMEHLLVAARAVNKDLMRLYFPDKGWPAHINALIAPTDYDTVLADAKKMLQAAKETAPERATEYCIEFDRKGPDACARCAIGLYPQEDQP